MNLVLLTRDSLQSRYMAQKLHAEHGLKAVVFEEAPSRVRMAIRHIRRNHWWRLFMSVCDIVFLYTMGRRLAHSLHSMLGPKARGGELPADLPCYVFQSANRPECVAALKELEPEVIMVFGTRILKEEVLNVPKHMILNIHAGIVPEYRGLACSYWALSNGDFDKLGVTVLYVLPGVDNGPVALQETLDCHEGVTLAEVNYEMQILAAELAAQAVQLIKDNRLPKTPQRKMGVRSWGRPGWADWRQRRNRFKIR